MLDPFHFQYLQKNGIMGLDPGIMHKNYVHVFDWRGECA